VADLVRHGGSSFGKPGMPSFGFVLTEREIEAVVQYVRTLPRAPRDLGGRETSPAARAPASEEHRDEGEVTPHGGIVLGTRPP
jgi:mono/diheme cytochrome c family protein